MIVRVKLFAAARERSGRTVVELELPAGATFADVQAALVAQQPELETIVRHARWALDAEFAAATVVVPEHAEVALIPPVSGG